MNTFDRFSEINIQRANRWHNGSIREWTSTDWATATGGEMGELFNAIKKLRRIETRIQGHDGDTPQPRDTEQALKAIAKEIGDVYTYLDILTQFFGLRMWDCVRDTFNFISEREGMPERMPKEFPAQVAQRSLTYLAVPYSHPDPAVRAARFDAANRAAAILIKQGELVFSPISHTHPIAEADDLPKGWDFWRILDHAYLAASKKLVVLCTGGWNESIGIMGEIEIAKKMGIPVEYMQGD